MSSGFYEDTFVTTTDQVKQQNNRFTLSKIEADLFDDNDHLVNAILNVKREASGGTENWHILKKIPDHKDEVIFIVEGEKLTKKEKAFLRTADGVLFLIQQAKIGINSFNALKKQIRENLK